MVALNAPRRRCSETEGMCAAIHAHTPGKPGVADGTRTRNSQNHNLELYH